RKVQPGDAVAGEVDHVALVGEEIADVRGDVAVVFDDENTHGLFTLTRKTARCGASWAARSSRKIWASKPSPSRRTQRGMLACFWSNPRPWMADSAARNRDSGQDHLGARCVAILDGSQKKMAQGGAIGGTHLAWAKKLLPRLP